jgi:flavonol synthase
MSNGRYKAVLHRTTVSREKTRMSWPVFVEPPPEHVVRPHPQLVADEFPAKYKAKKFKDYKYCKINKLPQEPNPSTETFLYYYSTHFF